MSLPLRSFKQFLFLLSLFLTVFTLGDIATAADAGNGESVILSWDTNPEPDIAGYRIHYGLVSGALNQISDTNSPMTERQVSGLVMGKTYYFAVLAYNTLGVEGPLSSEVSYLVPNSNPIDLVVPKLSIKSSLTGSLSAGQAIGPAVSVNLGSSTRAGTITLRNLGETTLSGLSLAITGPGASEFQATHLGTSTLSPGGIIAVSVTFTPTLVGPQAASLRISSNDPDHPQFDIAMSGTGLAVPKFAIFHGDGPELVSGIGAIEFGSVNPWIVSTTKSFTIRNLGSAPLSGLTVISGGTNALDFKPGPLPVTTLAPGASADFQVTFKPRADGLRSATLRLTSNDATATPFDVTLHGTGVATPQITLANEAGETLESVTPMVAPAVPLGSASAPMIYTISNTGTAPLDGISISTFGTGAASFTTSQPAIDSLPPGASTRFSVTFHPSSSGWRTAKFRVSSRTTVIPPREFSLTGIGTTFPVIQLTDKNRGRLSADSAPVDFDSVNLTDKRRSQAITLQNTGTAPLKNLKITCTGANCADFKVVAQQTSTVNAGASTRFKVLFSPSAVGLRTATVTLASNAGTQQFSVSGTGVAAPEIEVHKGKKKLKNGKAYVDLGRGQIGAKGFTQKITITNVGSSKLKHLEVLENDDSLEEFSVSRMPTRSLKPGRSVSFTVTFRSAKQGIRWGGIRISSNDEVQKEFEILLTGTGTTSRVPAKKSKGRKARRSKAKASPSFSVPLDSTNRPIEGIEVIDGRKFRTLTIFRSLGNHLDARDVEVSSDRVDWSSGARHTSVLRDDATALIVRDNTPVTQDSKRFIRLKN